MHPAICDTSCFACTLPYHLNARHEKGFTLIELSVVLVIIGLIAGGVLVGQDMIRQAQLRSIITAKTEYETAIAVFGGKYNCIPGDCADAQSFFGAMTGCPSGAGNTQNRDPATCNGDGDGRIEAYFGIDGDDVYEVFRVFQHLGAASLVGGVYSGLSTANNYGHEWNFPTLKFEGLQLSAVYPYSSDHNGHIFVIGQIHSMDMLSAGPFTFQPAMRTADVIGIDLKTDDGRPGTGSTRGYRGHWWFAPNPQCATTDNRATAEYNLNYTGKDACTLVFHIGAF